MKMAGAKWGEMSEKEKLPYEASAKEDRAR